MRGRRGTGALSYRPKKELEKLMVSQANQQSRPIEPRKRNFKQWMNKQRIKCVFFIDFHKKNISQWMKKSQKKFFQAMSKFIKTKTPQQCQNFLSQIKQRILSYDNWINQQKQLMTPQKYEIDKNKYIQELCKIKVDNEIYTQEEIMAHKTELINIQQSPKLKYDPNQMKMQRFEPKLQDRYNLRIPEPNLNGLYQNNQFLNIQSNHLIKATLSNNFQKLSRTNNTMPQRKKVIIDKCQYHWKQWLKCAQKLEALSKLTKQQIKQQNVKEQFIDIES